MKSIFLSLLLISSQAFAGSCCGGKLSFPALILGEERSQFTGSISQSTISDEVLSSGKWIRRHDNNVSQNFKFDAAAFIDEYWQAGVSIPVMEKSARSSSTSQGLGDVALFLGHVTFPEQTYSFWEPRGITFLQLTLPTGTSIYDENINEATEIRGRGFYSLGGGLILKKSWVTWDANLSIELHRSFSRKANNSSYAGDTDVNPGWGLSQSLGVGWNYGDWRVGTAVSSLYEEAINISGATTSEGTEQQQFTASLSGSYMLTTQSALSVNYSDQSLLGRPLNTSLAKSINIVYQQRFQE